MRVRHRNKHVYHDFYIYTAEFFFFIVATDH